MSGGFASGTEFGATLDVNQVLVEGETEVRSAVWRAGDASGPRLTKVGLWFVLITIVLTIAAANTGNNSLYLVIAAAVAVFVTSWWWARRNAQGLELLVEVPDELYAGSPAEIRYRLRRTRTGSTSDLLLVLDGSRAGALVRRLDGRGSAARRARLLGSRRSAAAGVPRGARRTVPAEATGRQDILFLERGLHTVGRARALSIFPLGMFRWQVTFSGGRSVIVYPELFLGVRLHSGASPKGWQLSGSRIGESEDLHSLRSFRSGDDPRRIHWKQSARSDQLVYQQRSEDEVRRVSLLVDSYVPEPSADDVRSRFERLVSEAATACVEYLEQGYEVELFLREGHLGFGSGLWQRRRLLEALALLECQSADSTALVEPDRAHRRVLRFSLSTVQPIVEDHGPRGEGRTA